MGVSATVNNGEGRRTTWPLMVVPAFSGCQPFLTMSLYLDMLALL